MTHTVNRMAEVVVLADVRRRCQAEAVADVNAPWLEARDEARAAAEGVPLRQRKAFIEGWLACFMERRFRDLEEGDPDVPPAA
jgi:hypothetical protein